MQDSDSRVGQEGPERLKSRVRGRFEGIGHETRDVLTVLLVQTSDIQTPVLGRDDNYDYSREGCATTLNQSTQIIRDRFEVRDIISKGTEEKLRVLGHTSTLLSSSLSR